MSAAAERLMRTNIPASWAPSCSQFCSAWAARQFSGLHLHILERGDFFSLFLFLTTDRLDTRTGHRKRAPCGPLSTLSLCLGASLLLPSCTLPSSPPVPSPLFLPILAPSLSPRGGRSPCLVLREKGESPLGRVTKSFPLRGSGVARSRESFTGSRAALDAEDPKTSRTSGLGQRKRKRRAKRGRKKCQMMMMMMMTSDLGDRWSLFSVWQQRRIPKLLDWLLKKNKKNTLSQFSASFWTSGGLILAFFWILLVRYDILPVLAHPPKNRKDSL